MYITLFDLLPGKQEIIDKLLPSGWQPLVVQLLAMAVLVAAFFFFFFKPVRKIVKTRQDYIEKNIKDSESKNRQAEDYLSTAHGEIKNAKLKAQDLIKDAQVQAIEARDKIIATTQAEVELLKAEAEKDIDYSRRQANDEIKKSIIDVALNASEKILEREVDEKDNRRIVENFIESLGEGDE